MKKECTVKELCEYYNLSRTTIERYMKNKGLPYKKIGTRSIRFDIEEVEKWMQENNKVIEYNYKENKHQ